MRTRAVIEAFSEGRGWEVSGSRADRFRPILQHPSTESRPRVGDKELRYLSAIRHGLDQLHEGGDEDEDVNTRSHRSNSLCGEVIDLGSDSGAAFTAQWEQRHLYDTGLDGFASTTSQS